MRDARGSPPAGSDPLAGLRGTDWAFRSPRVALRGRGVAARIDFGGQDGWGGALDRVTAALREIDASDDGGDGRRPSESVGASLQDGSGRPPAAGPVAFLALPFDRSAPGTAVIPAEVLGCDSHGRSWRTVLGDASTAPPSAGEPAGPQESAVPARSVTLRSVREPSDWCRAVATITDRIRAGELTKAVLFRELSVSADADFDPAEIFRSLSPTAPAGYVFSVDGLVGASPELLVSRWGDTVRAHPMAGTLPRTGDVTLDSAAAADLLSDPKMRAEHQITIDAVHDAILGWCSYLDSEPSPRVVAAGAVQHLATLVEGRLSHPLPSVLDLVAALHPTPAVGGSPLAAALKVLSEVEECDRDRIAGPVGWVDAAGNGEFAVAIRAALVRGSSARLLAGVGVVADSDPESELAETRAKFRAVLPAFTGL